MSIRRRIDRLERSVPHPAGCTVCRDQLCAVEADDEFPSNWMPGVDNGAPFPANCPVCGKRISKIYAPAVRAIWAHV